MKFAYTRLVADNVATLAVFYEKLLATPPKGTAEYVEFHPGGAILAIMSREVGQQIYGGVWSAGNSAAILEFLVEDVDAERKRIDGFVTDWLQQPKDMAWGNRSMLFRDPEGNPINFFKPSTA